MKSILYFSILTFHLFYYVFFLFLLYLLKQINLLILLQYLLTTFFSGFFSPLTFSSITVAFLLKHFHTHLYDDFITNIYWIKILYIKIIKFVDIWLINPQERECITAQCFIEISLNYVILIRELWLVANNVFILLLITDLVM